jgi:hypothetical protein
MLALGMSVRFLSPTAPPKIEAVGRSNAAKVSEPRSRKKSTQQKRGEFFAARPAASIFGNPKGGDVGVAFSLLTFFWRRKRKSVAAGLPPANAA